MLVTINAMGFSSTNARIPVEVESLADHFGNAEQSEVIRRRSRAFQDLAKSYTAPAGFELITNAPISTRTQHETSANYCLDLVIHNLNLRTSIPVEIAFNNRETIGTNFLKLESFAKDQKDGIKAPFGVLVVPAASLLNFGGWDSVYGSSQEYENLRIRMYDSCLSLPTYLIELHGHF